MQANPPGTLSGFCWRKVVCVGEEGCLVVTLSSHIRDTGTRFTSCNSFSCGTSTRKRDFRGLFEILFFQTPSTLSDKGFLSCLEPTCHYMSPQNITTMVATLFLFTGTSAFLTAMHSTRSRS